LWWLVEVAVVALALVLAALVAVEPVAIALALPNLFPLALLTQ
jgi:hypothetical protein